MTLKELGMQYREEEARIRKKIDILRKLKKSLAAPDRDLDARISDLYITALNLKSVGNYLMHYYDKENVNANEQ
ncbi:MAG: hypothetical protein ACI4QV_00100 [Acutalibacteraceae bacterium]